MSCFHSPAVVLVAALLASTAAQAQYQPQPQAPAPTPAATEPPAAARRTLLKVGTGLTRGFELGGFSGLSLPVVLGVEHTVAPNWTAYGNVFSGLQVLQSERFSPGRHLPFVRSAGLDAGVRYYYHQAKRQAKGRAAGPFVGNYLALHVPTTSMLLYRPSADAFRLSYDYTAVMGVWGLQRRLGRHGLIDAFVGAGLSNPRFSQYNPQTSTSQPRRQPGIATELGIRLSLVR